MLYLIVNPSSGTGQGLEIWKKVKKYLTDRDIPFKAVATQYDGHGTRLAEEICALPYNDIKLIVIGGDGTINEVINGITDFSKIRFGIIPTGSGNDFARGLDIGLNPEEQIEILARSWNTEAIDIGKAIFEGMDKTRYFAISSGVGLDAIVCKKALNSRLKTFLNKLKLGKLTYIILTIQSLFSMTTAHIEADIDGDKRKFDKVIFAAAMNFRAEGGGVPMAPHADARDGQLSVCIVHGIPKWKTFFYLPFLAAAKHENIKGFDIINCRKCQMKINEPMVLHADGEYCGDVTEVTFECMPEALRIIV